jgi:hypothetical protein
MMLLEEVEDMISINNKIVWVVSHGFFVFSEDFNGLDLLWTRLQDVALDLFIDFLLALICLGLESNSQFILLL